MSIAKLISVWFEPDYVSAYAMQKVHSALSFKKIAGRNGNGKEGSSLEHQE